MTFASTKIQSKMKKITFLPMMLLSGAMAFGQSFFVPTNYRGAFAPAPVSQWTDNWTNWDPQNTNYGTSNVNVTTSITTNTTWTSNNIYLLQGQIYVKNGAALTIQPGTVIMGDKATAGSGLFITQGSKLVADGTVNNPIVFTSNQPAGQRALGDWGGVVLMGKASNNNAGGTANIEGISPNADTQFGGGTSPDDNDNSGILRFVRIEFPGYVYQPNKEINGLTLGAVGRGTTIDYVQVSFSNDDAYEWFGGTVNCRHLVSYRNLDDDFDTDNGFSGHVQFGVAIRDPQIADNPSVSTSEGFESDNDPNGTTATPQTAAVFSNMTYVGPLRGNTSASVASGFRRGARIRRNSGLKIYNSIFMDGLRGVHIDGTACEANAANGVLKYQNNVVAGHLTNYSVERNATSTFDIISWFGVNHNDSLASSANILVDPYGNNFLNPDLRPAGSSIALSNYSFADAGINPTVIGAVQTTTSISYCVGQTASALSATGNSDCTIKWYENATGGTAISTPTPSTTAAGTYVYYVAQQNADGYEGPRTMVTVTVNALPAVPTINAIGATSFCTGGSVVLTSSAASGNVWSTNATTNAITVTTSGSYTVTVTDANSCSNTSAATVVNVSNSPAPTINASATQACSGDEVTLTASTADTYNWSNGATTQSITVTSSGSFTVTTTNTDACNGVGTSAATNVTFTTSPTATAGFSTNGNVVTFTNTSQNATSYSWDFGDFTNSSAATPVHAFAVNGTYTVVLTALNGNCSDTTVLTVAITAGIDELAGIENLNIYPNPAAETINVDFTNSNASVELTLVDFTGRKVSQQTIYNQGSISTTIDATNLSNGAYMLQFASNGNTSVKKVIIRK